MAMRKLAPITSQPWAIIIHATSCDDKKALMTNSPSLTACPGDADGGDAEECLVPGLLETLAERREWRVLPRGSS